MDRGLYLFGHLERMEESAWSSKFRTFRVSNSSPKRRPKKIWSKVIRSNLEERKISKDIP